jgi:hypothetical protein
LHNRSAKYIEKHADTKAGPQSVAYQSRAVKGVEREVEEKAEEKVEEEIQEQDAPVGNAWVEKVSKLVKHDYYSWKLLGKSAAKQDIAAFLEGVVDSGQMESIQEIIKSRAVFLARPISVAA